MGVRQTSSGVVQTTGGVVDTIAIPDSVTNHYPTDEGSGTTLTDNEGSINGTINGATWQTGLGTDNTFLSYDGADDVTDFNNPSTPLIPETDDWTAFFWVRPDALDGQIIFTQFIANSGNGRLVLHVSDETNNTDRFELYLGNDSSEPTERVQSTTTITTGNWYSLAIRRSGSTFSIHVDGSNENSVTDSGTRNILQTGNLYGARTSDNPNYDDNLTAHGDVGADEFWVASGALTDQEISDYHSNTAPRYS